jgi:hypothetical protein
VLAPRAVCPVIASQTMHDIVKTVDYVLYYVTSLYHVYATDYKTLFTYPSYTSYFYQISFLPSMLPINPSLLTNHHFPPLLALAALFSSSALAARLAVAAPLNTSTFFINSSTPWRSRPLIAVCACAAAEVMASKRFCRVVRLSGVGRD